MSHISAAEVLQQICSINPDDSGTDEDDRDFEDNSESGDEEIRELEKLDDISINDESSSDGEVEEDHIAQTINEVVRTVCGQNSESGIFNDDLLKSISGVVWQKIDVGEMTKIQNRIYFNDKNSGPTNYACRRINQTAFSAFNLIISESMIKSIELYTNREIYRVGKGVEVSSKDILAFIAVLYCKGVFAQKQPIRALWSKKYGLPIVSQLMSRNKFLNILRFIRFDDKR